MTKSLFLRLVAAAGLALAGASPAVSQASPEPAWETVDPNAEVPASEDYQPVDPYANQEPVAEQPQPGATAEERASDATTARVPRKDVFNAAEGVFGKGAEGLAQLIEDLLRDQGEPSAYITGREAGGAFVLGVRYGSGTLHHQIEGDRPVYWTGPSVGFDLGADANKVFVLVYNLHDSQRIFRRFPAAEGNAYAIGGFTASYLRRGDVVLIPVRMGVGLRLGINAGYMRFSQKNRWLPF
jgi:hypothetical protein